MNGPIYNIYFLRAQSINHSLSISFHKSITFSHIIDLIYTLSLSYNIYLFGTISLSHIYLVRSLSLSHNIYLFGTLSLSHHIFLVRTQSLSISFAYKLTLTHFLPLLQTITSTVYLSLSYKICLFHAQPISSTAHRFISHIWSFFFIACRFYWRFHLNLCAFTQIHQFLYTSISFTHIMSFSCASFLLHTLWNSFTLYYAHYFDCNFSHKFKYFHTKR